MKNSSQKTAETKLTEREIKFCILKYEDKLNDEVIAAQVGLSARQLYEWVKRPEIEAEINRLGKADTQRAVRFFQKNAMRAAQATVKLTETIKIKDKKGKERQEFVQPGETVRRAAADILQSVEINIKGPESEIPSNVVIYLPDNKRRKK